jgi:REP element-mobilizing transposase RayT
MPRKSRVIYEGAIYHIYQRGNNKEFIFEDNSIKLFFLRCLHEYNKKFDYEILAYVIMNNHYHLLIKANKTPISEIMFNLHNLLGKFIKNQLNRSGHAFDGRYRSRVVDTDSYLIWLLRYIHRNPVKGNICSSIDEYPWSSHRFYRSKINSNVNTELILGLLGYSKETAVRRYLELINLDGDKTDKDKDYDIIKGSFRLEERPFVKDEMEVNVALNSRRKSWDEILSGVSVSGEEMSEIKAGTRKQSFTSIKLKIIEAALKECYSIKEIADHLNAAPSTISKLISRSAIHLASGK